MRQIDYQIEDFLAHCQSKGLAKKTIKSYNACLLMLAQWLETKGITDAEKVKSGDIDAYINWVDRRGHMRQNKSVSKITINGYIRDIKVFFNWMVDYDYINKSPVRIKQFKVERPTVAYVDDNEFRELLKSINKSKFPEYRDNIIIQTLLDTGMRIGECLSLKDSDVNFKNNSIFLEWDKTKGKKSRTVFFGMSTRNNLKLWIRHRNNFVDTDYLFPNQFGTELAINTFERNLRVYQARIGLSGITPKTFRNNFAKRYLKNGGDIYTLSRILGHSSVTVTEKAYCDLDDDDIKSMYISPISRIK